MITNVTDGRSDGMRYKDVTAESCETELQNKTLPYIEENTYRFDSLLSKVTSDIPLWTVGHIDSSVSSRYRTFEEVDTDENVLNFMLENMQDAYQCIFEFDASKRIINVYDQDGYAASHKTDIHITDRDIIDSMDISESSDDLYTAISVYGDNNLSINAVNPLGTSVIYNFDYYLDWMPTSLSNKVSSWQNLVDSVFNNYYSLNVSYYDILGDISDISLELEKLNIQKTQYQRCRDNIVAESDTYEIVEYNKIITDAGGTAISTVGTPAQIIAEIDIRIREVNAAISVANTSMSQKQRDKTSTENSINAIREQVRMENYFSPSELEELSNYIIEGDYQDEYTTITDSMTSAERLQQMRILYDRGVIELHKVSQPTQEFSVDVESFVFEKSFSNWTSQLETGAIVNVEIDTDNIAELFLSQITCNFDDKTVRLTFGNRFNRYDPRALFENALGDIKKTSNSLSSIKDVLTPITDGTFDEMEATLANSRNLSKESVLAATDQEILIDDTGLTGRKKKPDGTFEPEQVKINHQNIVFTDNGWQGSGDARLALGKIMTPQGTYKYGLNAEVIMGNMIMGNALNIVSGSSASQTGFVVDGDGIHVYYNGTETIRLDSATGKITARSGYIGNGTNGFTISDTSIYNGKSSLTDSKNGIYIGTDGVALGANSAFKVTNTGAVTASDLSITGGTIKLGGKTSLTDNHSGVYIGSDGIALGASSAFKVTNSGDLSAKNIAVTGGTIKLGGKTSLTDNHAGVYIGSDGIALGANSVFKVSNTGAVSASDLAVTGGTIKLGGKTSLSDSHSGVYIGSDGIALGASSAFKVTDAGTVTASALNITGGTIKLGGKTSLTDDHAGVYIGSNGIALGANSAFKVTSAGAVTATNLAITGGSININNAFNVTSAGAVTATNLAITGGTIKLGGKTSLTDNHSGVYIGSDGIALGANSAFKVDSSGSLYAKTGTFEGNVYAKNIKVGSNEGYIVNNQIANYTIEGSTKIEKGSVTGGGNGCIDQNTVSYGNTSFQSTLDQVDINASDISAQSGEISTLSGNLSSFAQSLASSIITERLTVNDFAFSLGGRGIHIIGFKGIDGDYHECLGYY